VVRAVRAAVGPDARLMVDANSCYTPQRAIEVGRFLDEHGVAYFEEPPGICYLGGLVRTLAVAELADRCGLTCTPHSANLSLVMVFTLHLMAAIPNAGSHAELSIEPDAYYPWQAGLFDPPLEVRDGAVAVPDGPGWGVEVSPSWLARAEHRVSEL
jgi:L-alanine-DL-glutamate epimerase-like enolase superfamily enzyme